MTRITAAVAQPALFSSDTPTSGVTPEASAASFTRRRLLQAAGLTVGAPGLMLAAAPAHAAHAVLQPAADLREQLAQALKRGEPLVVMVSLEGCPFCVVARDHYLAPLYAEGRIEVVQVDKRSRRTAVDFDGKPTTHDELSNRWGARVAPTVLFFGRGGKEVAERLVGGYLPDFYAAYLDERLAQGRKALQQG
ncbi:MAG: hypothetical protein Fur0019_14440 [Tibeticola sp.]